MADDRSERPVGPRGSPYLRRPLRTLKEAEQDNDASAHQLISLLSPRESSAPRAPVHRDAANPKKVP
jgi:hypothetical protein